MAEQVRRAVARTYRNATSFGGDASRLFICGHSSGGHLAGVALTTDWKREFDLPVDLIKGGLCCSGLFDLRAPGCPRGARDPDIRRYFPDGKRDRQQTQEELEWFLNGHPAHPELGLWATILRPTQRFIGRCGLLPWTIDGRNEVEVAYLIDPAFQGQGLATEAAQGIVRYAFEVLRLPRLICMMFLENTASVTVARKIGMEREAEKEDDKGKFLLYACHRDAYAPTASATRPPC